MTASPTASATGPVAAPAPFEYRRRVAWTEVDPSGNYQFSAALRYAEEAEIALLRTLGLLERLYPHLPRTFVRADFREPAHFDDELTVAIRVGRVGRSSVEFDFEVRRGAALCAAGTLGSANIGPDGHAAPLEADIAAELARQAARAPRDPGPAGEQGPAAERRRPAERGRAGDGQVVHGCA